MNFKIAKTKKNGILGLAFVAAVVTAFIAGGYVATNNWNPWGNKHYYQVLNANFQECHTLSGVSTCSTEHNTIFNTGALWVEQMVEDGASTPSCAVSATCSMHFIAMSGSTVTIAATDASTGATQGNCGAAGSEGGVELASSTGFGRTAGTVVDITGGTGAQSTVKNTFTAAAITTVTDSCLVNTGTISSGTNVQLAEASFTAITLQVGDTIAITWTITYSWT
jgi:hypothetical protein